MYLGLNNLTGHRINDRLTFMYGLNFEEKLNKIFDDTTTSYKYYWWLGILSVIQEEKKETISFDRIIIRILVLVWYPLIFYKISFGKQDQLSKIIIGLKNYFVELNDNINDYDLESFLWNNKNQPILKKAINDLSKYVPYRFLRPWMEERLRGIKDAEINSLICSFQFDYSLPYNIIDKSLVVNKTLLLDFSIISIFEKHCLFELYRFVEKNNPGLTNISIRLFKPKLRNLQKQTWLWKDFVKESHNLSVFDSKPLINLTSFSLDHYLPWSYVTHDEIWNLHPVEKSINSMKSNLLPSCQYNPQFISLQTDFFKYMRSKQILNLNDFRTLFNNNELKFYELTEFEYGNILKSRLDVESEKATQMGFSNNWLYNVK